MAAGSRSLSPHDPLSLTSLSQPSCSLCLLWHPQAGPAWMQVVFVVMHLLERPRSTCPGQGMWCVSLCHTSSRTGLGADTIPGKGGESSCLRGCRAAGALGTGGRTDPTGHWEAGPGSSRWQGAWIKPMDLGGQDFSSLLLSHSEKSFRSTRASSALERDDGYCSWWGLLMTAIDGSPSLTAPWLEAGASPPGLQRWLWHLPAG